MRKGLILTWREFTSYFASPIGWVAMFVFVFLAGLVFAFPYFGTFVEGGIANLRIFFKIMPYILVIIIPILAIKGLAGEFGSGTVETLMTAPVTDAQIVGSKFFGCWLAYLALLAPTFVYVLVLDGFSDLDYGPVASGYIGMALVGALYVSIGMLAGSFSVRLPVVAELMAMMIALTTLGLFAWVLPLVAWVAPKPWRGAARLLAFPPQFEDFSVGVVNLSDGIYFVALALFFLFVTTKVMEARRWR